MDFKPPFALEIFCYKLLKIHLKVVLHELQSRVIIAHHKMRILPHYMDLLYLLLIKFAQHTVIVKLITDFVIRDNAFDFHSAVQYKKSAFKRERSYF